MVRINFFYTPIGAALLFVLCAAALSMGCSDDARDIDPVADADQTPDAGAPDVSDGDTPSPTTDVPGTEEDVDRPPEDSGGEWEWGGDDEFEIIAVSPAHGPVEGGTTVFVHGGDLTDSTQLLFGGQEVDAELTQGQLVAETPAADGPGPVTVRAISTDGEVSEIPNGFTYANPVEVDEIVPDQLPTTGGVEITLHGSGFVEPMGVSFSGEPARRIDVVNGTMARVVTPPMPRGHADVRISIPDDQALLEDGVYFYSRLDVDAVDPAVGDIGGGEAVTIRGAGFTPDTTVSFGDRDADIQSVNVAEGSIDVITPAATAAGAVDVYLENSHDAERVDEGFFYDDADTDSLLSIQPDTAPVAGGTEHIVSGRNLDAGDAQIYVGDEQATIVDADSAHALVEVPAAESGSADVIFYRDGVEVDRLDDGIEYLSPLSVDSVEPATGEADGGETVVISGEGLENAESVSFGGLPAAFETNADGELSVVTPSSEPGSVDIIIADADREIVVDDGFYFEGPLEVWSMRPTRGALAGNTYVTLQGQGFDGTIDVAVGDEAASDIRRHDPYTVTFRTPPGSSQGAHEVTLEAMDQQAQPPHPFVYFNPMSSFGGAFGPPVNGSINITAVTQEGTPIPGAFAMLSVHPETPYQGMTDANGQVTLSGPDLLGPQMITVTAPEMSTFTVRELNAENLTVILNPLEPPEGAEGEPTLPPIGEFQGNITITGKGTDPEGGKEYNMSMVRVTRPAINGMQLNPGANSVVEGEGNFSLRSRVGDVVLIGLCGLYNEETEHFQPKMMAVERNLSISDGQLKDVDLECNIPLEEYLPVKLTNPVYAPDGPTINEITTYVDFGYEGVFRMPNPVVGLDDILMGGPLPRAEGELSDITYGAVAGSYTGAGLPYTQTTIEDIPEVDQLTSTSPLVGVPELQMPVNAGTIDGEIRFGLKGANQPDFFYIVLRNPIGLPVWTFLVPGNDDMIPMPELPSFDDLSADARPNPYQPGTLYTVTYAPRIDGFDYNAFTYGDFNSGRWSAFSVDSWLLKLID